MDKYLGEFPVKLKDTPFAKFTNANWALYYIERYGGIDGEHHKQWLIDQVARILNGGPVNVVEARWGGGHTEYRVNVSSCDQYTAWVTQMKAGEDGPETYSWDKGDAAVTREQGILCALAAADRGMYGLDLVKADVAKRHWLYVVLGRLEESGLIEGHEEDGIEPPQLTRRLYRITDAGRAAILPIAKVIP